ncbi:hypothetical protein DLAC_07099 [Tieghemostelium lacteum]|uniref:S-adenosyl-methyltransferase n=1 Tax=Tieghemostelium lacteum TaxID=361077 RepID=A0A151ZE65_TIELA|nr:hypothetical protein DLAC_07099 [Tieghemostelium lacteum]|eukprot:KYQ92252.1 hypothetical protein DLAC_07099 [Tieghemostelium lacteum]
MIRYWVNRVQCQWNSTYRFYSTSTLGGKNDYPSYQIHKPVMYREVLQRLKVQPGSIIVDCTFGLGGHTRNILESCKSCYVIAIDRDPEVFDLTKDLRKQYSDRLITLPGQFSQLGSLLRENRLNNLKISGILFDYGCSSYQIDSPHRGFSFKKELEGPLDMRMNSHSSSSLTAFQVINSFSESELRDIFYFLGEEKHTKMVTREILRIRQIAPIQTTSELVKIIESQIPYPAASKSISRIFRAIRMYVNDEIQEIEKGLKEAELVLEPNGHLVTISFHSIEDRIVKKFLQSTCTPSKFMDIDEYPQYPHDEFKPSFEIDEFPQPLLPTTEEIEWNSRSASAILRSAKRTSAPPLGQYLKD